VTGIKPSEATDTSLLGELE